jgi:hypothetical protein
MQTKMRISFPIGIFVVGGLACLLPSLCCGQNLTIATLDGQSGKPLKHITVFLYASDLDLYPTAKGIQLLGRAETSADGSVQLSLPSPVPKMLLVSPEWDFRWITSCEKPQTKTLYDTDIVLKSGVLADNSNCGPKGQLTAKLTATPGRIVLFARKLTARERFKLFFIGGFGF